MGLKYIEQPDEKDCGPTCLAMISHYYGKKVSIARLREYSGTDIYGTNILGMVNGGKNIGLDIEAFEVDNLSELHSVQLPCIAHINTNNGFEHFVIIEKMKNDKVTIVDPDGGRKKLSLKYFIRIWNNIILTIKKRENFSNSNEAPSVKNFFLYIFKQNHSFIWSILFTSLIINSISILSTFYFKYLIDKIVPSNLVANLNKLSIGFLILYITFGLSSFLRYQLVLNMGLKINKEILMDYYNHILNLPKNFFETRKDGEILSRFRDTDHIREAFTSITVTLLIDLVMVVVGFFILFSQNKTLFCIVLFFIPFYYLIMFLFKRPFEKYNRKEMELNSKLSSKFIEGIHGIDTIKSYTNENAFLYKIQKEFIDFLNKVYKLGFFTNLQMSIKDFMHLFTVLIILWIGSIEVIHNNMTLGELITFNALVVYFFGPIERLVEVQPTIQSAVVATRRILEILDLNEEKANEKANSIELEKIEKIEFSNVDFQYGHRKKTLSDINFSINQNQSLALVGESGSGKSTIAKLILKYYNPTRGNIKINAHTLRNFKYKDIRSKIGYVSQTPFLFNGTIRDNLLLDNTISINNEELIHACQMAECWDFIKSTPHKLDTIIEGNGMNISGGQAQRIALARAILKAPDLLILDEPTSSLDTTISNKIKRNLNSINCMKIIITHDVNLSKICDNILVFSKGKILGSGNHNHLIKKSKKYNELWKNQHN